MNSLTEFMAKKSVGELYAIIHSEEFDYDIRIHATGEIMRREGDPPMGKEQHREIKVNNLRRNSIYIACEELDFTWSSKEVYQFNRYMKNGKTLEEIAELFERNIDEVRILHIDWCRRRRPRKMGRNLIDAICGN
ncbi:hypothetical protein [Paenibacillus sp. SN-8-1]|uniref:hypothetical protein n=1 Tax=Paenibacillus sp. SN-8-1 TaxID=3435409 RepID=UPI003D9A9869